MRARTQRGFTLGQLYGWLALIGLSLGAVGWAVYDKAGRQTETSWCSSNVKQLCTALIFYATDFDSHLPAAPPTWPLALATYTKNDQILTCTAATIDQTFNSSTHIGPVDAGPDGVSYAMNAELCGASLKCLLEPHRRVLLFDCLTAPHRPCAGGPELLRCNHLGDDPSPTSPHGDGLGAAAFADGHVRMAAAAQLMKSGPASAYLWSKGSFR